jgi:integrase
MDEERRQDILDRLRAQINDPTRDDYIEDITPDDREKLIEFSDELFLLQSEYGIHRHEKLLRHLKILAVEVGGLADALDDRDATEDLIRWINRYRDDSEETNKDYRVALRMFGKRTGESDEIPSTISWVPGTTSNSYDPAPDPGDLFTWEEVQDLADAATNLRDAALVAVAMDLGARSGELRNISIGDVTDYEHGYRIHLDGKTGQRSVTIIEAAGYLRNWISQHPRGENGNAPLWCKLKTGDGMSYKNYTKILKRLERRVETGKTMNLTNFRKSNFADMLSRGVPYVHACRRQGRNPDSQHNLRYLATFAEDTEREHAKAYGIDVEEEEEAQKVSVRCPRCEQKTPRDKSLCVWCGQVLSQGAAEVLKDFEESKDRDLAALDRDEALVLLEAQGVLDEYPGLKSLLAEAES